MTQGFYPIIMTNKFSETINFYEDYFNFVPDLEMDCFALLKHKINSGMQMAVIHHNHITIPKSYHKTVQGLVLNYPVENVHKIYEHFFMEGLELKSLPALAPCGRRHFLVEDPNGILIDVMQEYDPFKDSDTTREQEFISYITKLLEDSTTH